MPKADIWPFWAKLKNDILAARTTAISLFGKGWGNMIVPRRRFLHLAAGVAALPALPRVAFALDYPTRPVHVIVGFPGGSISDVQARLIGQWLSDRLGQPFIIENKPGASGNIATEFVVRAPPDGYTLLLIGSNHAVNASLFGKLSFDSIRDIAPVAGIMHTWGVMEVNPSVPARTAAEFIAYAKANPGKITMATAGKGSILNMYGALFMLMTGIDLVDVTYRGAPPALIDVIAGRAQLMFDNVATSLEQIRAGKVRPLAVTATKRLDVLPDVPPLSDFVPGYEAGLWQGLAAPKGTPAEIVDKLNATVNAGLADPAIKARLTQYSLVPMPMTPADFGKLIADEAEKWGKVIREAHITAG